LNIKTKLNYVKKLLSEILKDRIESEELKELVERAETIEELNEILVNNNLTPLEKDIELIKMVAKKNVQNNRFIGMKSKIALVTIINKSQPVKHIVLELISYMNANDLSI